MSICLNYSFEKYRTQDNNCFYTRNKFINFLLLVIAVTGKWIKCTQYHQTSNNDGKQFIFEREHFLCVLDKSSETGNSINLFNSSLFSHPVHLNRNNKQTNFQLKMNGGFYIGFHVENEIHHRYVNVF